ncbi:MAG TPA: porin, partial [Longimicrobium sp.]|nr:porin [Longimicrobium sp.]
MIPLSSTRRAALPGLLALALAGPAALHAQGTSAARQDTVRATPAATAAAAPAAAPAGSVVTAVAGADGFGLRSADGSFVLRVKGGVQYDGRFFAEDQADALVNTFQIRRARSDFQGTLYRDYDFRVQLELSGTRVELLDAYVDARLHPALRVRAGKMKGPVGLERLLTPWEIPFNDRALPTSLVPNRETGVQVHGAVARGNLTYQLGFFNGTTD